MKPLSSPTACLLLPALLAGTVTASAQDTVQLRTNYYTIAGATESELRQSINQMRPWKDKDPTDARTEWNIQWKYSTIFESGAYRLRSFDLKTTITYTLPRLTPGRDAPPALRDRWAKYSAALKTHEDGHSRIAVAGAGEIRKRLKALSPASSAQRLEKELNAAVEKVLAEHRELEAAYDKKTAHGATQGAHFP